MSWRRAVSRLLGIGGRRARDEELREEIDAHLALIEEEYRGDGLAEGDGHVWAVPTLGLG